MLHGIGGTLLSSSFLAERLQAALQGGNGRGASRFPMHLRSWWCRVRQAVGPATSVRALIDAALRPLLMPLGVDVARATRLSDEIWRAELRAADVCLPGVITPWGRPLEATWRAAALLGLASRSRWCLLFNGTHLRVFDTGAASSRRHLEFDLETIADHERSAGAAWLLLARACFAPDPETHPRDTMLARLVDLADREGADRRAGLQAGVREALEHLTSGMLPPARTRSAAGDLAAAYQEALTAVYRMLFLLFAEARGLVPSWHPVYAESYTMDALRADAERTREAPGLWETFQAMSRLAYAGCEAGDLRVTAFNGRLFAPQRAPLLDTKKVPDPAIRSAVRALSSVATPRGRERISYRDLGVEQLGAVYETLLEYEPTRRSGEPSGAAVALTRTGPERRKTSGTFYTPEAITRYLVRHALEPLTADASPDAVLSLRLADPAMGSGAFLVAACRELAAAYEAALVRDGQCLASDITERDRAGFRRLVAQRCLFGVDVNPMAVHLARLSLWLTTLAADRPLGFLDHHLLVGDSLLGTTMGHAVTGPSSRHRAAPDERQLPLFDLAGLHVSVRNTLPVRGRLERDPEGTAGDVRAKEAALEALEADGELRRWREVCDLWCAAFLGAGRMPAGLFAGLVDHVLQRSSALPPAVAERALAPVRRLAADRRLLHWPLALPEVFCDEAGRERPDGGFDAVVGNPPWEVIRADAGRLHGGDRCLTRFTRASGVYHAQSDGHPNLYQVFLERAVQLTRPGGRLGLVLPHGLASDRGGERLRHLLLSRCAMDRLVGFQNRGGVFPIHRSVRFLLVTATRGCETKAVRCRFGIQDPSVLDGLSEQERLDPDAAFPVRLTPALLERLSGPGLAIPELRTATDLRIAERLAAAHPRVTAHDGWAAQFGRELNASDDSRHFSRTAGGLRVVEGKHLRPFVVRGSEADRYITVAAARRLLPHQPYLRERLAFRDVASAGNRTTLIAALVPAGYVTTHTLFCLRTALARDDQLLLCALLNSYVANYLVRMRVSSHVSLAILDTLPVPRLRPHDGLGAALVRVARTLASGAGDDQAEVQALAARAYGLDRRAFAHVLATFPLVPAEDRIAAWRGFTAACRT